jgi:hypothetical protein
MEIHSFLDNLDELFYNGVFKLVTGYRARSSNFFEGCDRRISA